MFRGKICRDPAYNGKITIWIFYANTIYVGLRTSLNQFRIKLHIEILRFSVLVKFMLLAPAKNINQAFKIGRQEVKMFHCWLNNSHKHQNCYSLNSVYCEKLISRNFKADFAFKNHYSGSMAVYHYLATLKQPNRQVDTLYYNLQNRVFQIPLFIFVLSLKLWRKFYLS